VEEFMEEIFGNIRVGDWVMWKILEVENGEIYWDVGQITGKEILGNNHNLFVQHPEVVEINFGYYFQSGGIKLISKFSFE